MGKNGTEVSVHANAIRSFYIFILKIIKSATGFLTEHTRFNNMPKHELSA